MSRRQSALLLAAALTVLMALPVLAGRAFRQSAVGGVSIDTEGVVREPDVESRKMLLAALRKDIGKVRPELSLPVPMRKISLRRLHDAIQDAFTSGVGQLPDEIKYLAGLQRIEYILVYPEQNDIVLAGPGEGWKVDKHANVVGVTTGRPVLQLDDLLVALRYVHDARTKGISCSIDPTPEGSQRLNNLLGRLSRIPSRGRRNVRLLEKQMKDAFGPQQVKITGVPATSHFARVLLAADYRMKRLAMALDRSPVKGLTSYVALTRSKADASTNPRWWLACNYEPVARSKDGLAWQIRGKGVKAMTEDDFVDATGKRAGTGRKSAAAQKWADMLTAKYDELCTKDGVFGELRNIMDMCVVAAVIEHHDLLNVAGARLPMLYKKDSQLAPERWNAPKTVSPQCSFIRSSGGLTVTASGGVQVESWQAATKTTMVDSMQDVRKQAQATPRKSWWWN